MGTQNRILDKRIALFFHAPTYSIYFVFSCGYSLIVFFVESKIEYYLH